jgi:hypothetical protein
VFQSDNSPLATIGISVTVLPFQLDRPDVEYSIYYRGKLVEGQGSISSEFKSHIQLSAEFRNMINHGIDNPNVYQPFENIGLLDKYFSLRKQSGLKKDSIYYVGISTGEPSNPTAVLSYVEKSKRLLYLLSRYGYANLYIYGIDEASPELIQKQIRVWKQLQSGGVNIFAAGYSGNNFESAGDVLDLFVDGDKNSPQKHRAAQWHGKGKRIYLYNNPQVGLQDPNIYRRTCGLRVWQSKYDGVMLYAYQDGFGAIWNDFDHPTFRDHVFAYPTVDGVVDTIAWEGFREGVDDVRYLSTLHRKFSRLSEDLSIDSFKELKRARSLLEDLQLDEGRDLNGIRNSVIVTILELCKLEETLHND